MKSVRKISLLISCKQLTINQMSSSQIRPMRILQQKKMLDWGLIALFYCGYLPETGEGTDLKDDALLECRETEELVQFVQSALGEIRRRGATEAIMAGLLPESVHITRELRIFIGRQEVKVRPMAKTVLLLFLRHPEGIPLKRIADYHQELLGYYKRVMRCLDNDLAEARVQKILDIFNNDLNVQIARVNAALSALVTPESGPFYRIQGSAGKRKSILLDRRWMVWDT